MLSSYIQLLKQLQCFEMSTIFLRLWFRCGENSINKCLGWEVPMILYVMENQVGSSVNQSIFGNNPYFRAAQVQSFSIEFKARSDICRHVAEPTYVEPTSLHNRNFAELPKRLDESVRSISLGERRICVNPADIQR